MKKLITYLTLVFTLLSCLDNTTFVAEPYDPRMPAFSSTGKNTSGAYVNNHPRVDINDSCDQMTCYDKIKHEIRDDSLYLYFNFEFQFRFVIEDLDQIENAYSHFIGKNFELNGEHAGIINGEESHLGKITFKRTNFNVLAGTFYFSTNSFNVTKGRFDYGYPPD